MIPKKNLVLSAACFLLAALLALILSSTMVTAEEEDLAARISPEILRFHVLANSDTPQDQELKLKVRNVVLNSIYEELGPDASLEETKTYIRQHSADIEKTAESYMKSQGYSYFAHMELATSYFPTKVYGDMVFPCGSYEAARLILGQGEGKNWWCVLYPPLCFTDNTYGVVPDSSKEVLKETLDPQDFQMLLRPHLEKQDPKIEPAAQDIKKKEEQATSSSDNASLNEETPEVQVRVKFKLLELLGIR